MKHIPPFVGTTNAVGIQSAHPTVFLRMVYIMGPKSHYAFRFGDEGHPFINHSRNMTVWCLGYLLSEDLSMLSLWTRGSWRQRSDRNNSGRKQLYRGKHVVETRYSYITSQTHNQSHLISCETWRKNIHDVRKLLYSKRVLRTSEFRDQLIIQFWWVYHVEKHKKRMFPGS